MQRGRLGPVPFEEPGIQMITLSLVSIATLLSFVSLMLGLFSTWTGKDPLPTRIRNRLRRTPASAEDFRLRGIALMLTGAAVMLVVSLVTINVVNVIALDGISGYAAYAPSDSVAFPRATVLFVNTVAALAALACFSGAYALSVRVRYIGTRPSTGPLQGTPPA